MRRFLIACVMLMSCAVSLIAQNESLASKYLGADGVSTIYVSKAMFDLIGTDALNSVDADGVKIGDLVEKLDGIYIIESDSTDIIAQLKLDLQTLSDDMGYSKLMQINDGGEAIEILARTDAEDKSIIRDFIVAIDEGKANSFMAILLNGKFTAEDIKGITSEL